MLVGVAASGIGKNTPEEDGSFTNGRAVPDLESFEALRATQRLTTGKAPNYIAE
jgi:hypothetical protein